MPGYSNRTIRFDFPDLSEDGDLVHVVIKNPKILPPAELIPDSSGGEGESEADSLSRIYPIIARLVKAWHVYDGTADGDDLPLLPLPATPEAVAKLPFPILNKISEAMREVVAPGN